MIRIAIVEDNEDCAKSLRDFIARYSNENAVNCETMLFANGLDFIGEYRKVYDIVFMDIEMPYLDGMETAKKLREVDKNICIIFITNMAHYAIKGYEVEAQDFMVKPVGYFNFSIKLEKALRSVHNHRVGELVIPYEEGLVRLFADDILYIEIIKHSVLYHTYEKTYTIRSSMTKAEEMVAGLGFAKCNSCYLVNFKHVSQINNNYVFVGKDKLQISRAKKKTFINSFTTYLGGRIK